MGVSSRAAAAARFAWAANAFAAVEAICAQCATRVVHAGSRGVTTTPGSAVRARFSLETIPLLVATPELAHAATQASPFVRRNIPWSAGSCVPLAACFATDGRPPEEWGK